MGRDLTECPLPLIIILVGVLIMPLGVGALNTLALETLGGQLMQIHLYKLPEGKMDALVIASVGKGLAPVLLKDVTPQDLPGRLLPIVEEMRRPKANPQELPM